MDKRYVKRKEIVRRFEWKRFQVILTFHQGNIDRWRGTCRVVSENWGELSQNSLWRWVNWTNDTALERKLSGQSIDERIHAIFACFIFFFHWMLQHGMWKHHTTRPEPKSHVCSWVYWSVLSIAEGFYRNSVAHACPKRRFYPANICDILSSSFWDTMHMVSVDFIHSPKVLHNAGVCSIATLLHTTHTPSKNERFTNRFHTSLQWHISQLRCLGAASARPSR